MNHPKRFSWNCWNPQQRQLIDAFQKHGCSLVSCYPENPTTGFVHTVGLEYCSEHPEFLSLELPKQEGKRLLDTLATKVQAGQRFRVGPVYEPQPGHAKIRFVPLEQQDYQHLMVAAWFYHYQPFRALKVVAA